ncbi:MAG: hypothetical protein QM726_25870 [Chitinophagaceae bacterium]
MLRIFLYLAVIATIFCMACSGNDNNGNETLLYGTWTKGANAGDTIWFMKKNGKNIMRTNQSFNPLLPTYSETEYSFKDGKLIMILPITSSAMGVIDSFTWQEYGKKFEITGYQVYMFMSSMATKFSFTKTN